MIARLPAVLLALVLPFTAAAAAADFKPTRLAAKDPLEPVAGTGILVLVLSSTLPIAEVRINRRNTGTTVAEHEDLGAGDHLALWRLAVGQYCLSRFHSGWFKFDLGSESKMCFDVKEGTVSYPGNVRFSVEREIGTVRYSFQTTVLEKLLAAERPALLEPGIEWYFDTDGQTEELQEWMTNTHRDAKQHGLLKAFDLTIDPNSPYKIARRGDDFRLARGRDKDLYSAFEHYARAADLGHGRAAMMACQQLDLGFGLAADPVTAVSYCRKGVAAGEPLAAWYLERMHARSRGGLKPDAAEQARLKALFGDEVELGRAVMRKTWGLRDPQDEYFDPVEARRLAQVRADSGEHDGAFALAFYLADGIGGPADGAGAIRWYLKAAEGQGNGTAWVRIASLYWHGKVVPRDLAKAREHYEKAVKLNVHQTNELAWFLATGPDPKFRDGKRAVKLMTKYFETYREGWGSLDTLAAAYATAGDFEKAVAQQTRALDMARNAGATKESFDEIEARLALYRAKQIYVREFKD